MPDPMLLHLSQRSFAGQMNFANFGGCGSGPPLERNYPTELAPTGAPPEGRGLLEVEPYT